MPEITDMTLPGTALQGRIDAFRDSWSSLAQRRIAADRAMTSLGRLSANELADLGISAGLRR